MLFNLASQVVWDAESIAVADIQSIAVESLAGNDLVDLSAVTVANGYANLDGQVSVDGGLGSDTLIGSDFADLLYGNDHSDLLKGGEGDDTLLGGDGVDTIYGGAGNDFVDGGEGADLIYGGAGDDLLYGREGGGGDGYEGDTIFGGSGNDTLYGADGNEGDILLGEEGNDFLYGQGGNDTLDGGSGINVLDGGAGSDTYRFATREHDSAQPALGSNTIIEAAETDGDTLDFSEYDAPIAITLGSTSSQTVAQIGAGTLVIQLSHATSIEHVIGTAYDDEITGNTRGNRLEGRGGDDFLNGVSGVNTLLGGAGDDLLLGGAGNDFFDGGGGNDSLVGSGGNDTYRFVGLNLGTVTVYESGTGGTDTLDFSELGVAIALDLTLEGPQVVAEDENLTLEVVVQGAVERVIGTAFNDLIIGSDTASKLEGLAGNDTLIGGSGNDTLIGGEGDDSLEGGAGADSLLGGEGNDTLQGGDGDDHLDGGDDEDSLLGGTGDDTLIGGAGDDVLYGGEDNDSLIGGTGNDTLEGGAGDDVYAFPNPGSVDLGTDNILEITGEDNDLLDALDFRAFGAGVAINLATTSTQTVHANLRLNLNAADVIEVVHGSPFNDQIVGNARSNLLLGYAGSDTLEGADGDDTLDGGTGDDTLKGGAGSDTFRFTREGAEDLGSNRIEDVIPTGEPNSLDFRGFNAGVDVDLNLSSVQAVHSSLAIQIVNWRSVLRVDGSPLDDTLRGTDLPDRIYGHAGDDILIGGGSADTISGGQGNDSIDGGAGDDLLFGDFGNNTILGGSGRDTIVGGKGDDSLLGGSGNDLLFGEEGDDTIDGGDGADEIYGGLGNDWLYGGAHADTIHGGAGDDWIDGGEGANSIMGGAGHDTLLASGGSSTLSGDGGDDVLVALTTSTSAAMTLLGGAGNDLLVGGISKDSLVGGSGRDILIGGQGIDTLLGGDGDDILIDGTTTYSADLGDLDIWAALHAIWASPLDYTERIDALVNHAQYPLVSGSTVLVDTSVETLRGGAGDDWFFASTTDTVADLQAGEWRGGNSPPQGVVDDVAVLLGDSPSEVDLWEAFDDDTTADAALQFAVVANSNPGLFSDVTIVGGSPTKLVLSYAANTWGKAYLTLRATDAQGLYRDVSFGVEVALPPDVPLAFDDDFQTDEAATLFVSAARGVLRNDVDPEDDLLHVLLVASTSHGTLALASSGAFQYQPDGEFTGIDTFVYRVTDGVHVSGDATVRILVGVAPAAVADEYETDESASLVVAAAAGVLANDEDPTEAALVAQLVEGPLFGDLTLNGDGSFTYVPLDGFVGQDQFVYLARSEVGSSTPAQVTITVRHLLPSVATLTIPSSGGNPKLSGTISGGGNRAGVLIEFDYNGDDLPDGYALTNPQGQFQHMAGLLPIGEPSVIRARVADFDPVEGEFVYSDWTSANSHTYNPGISVVAPIISGLVLANDTGQSDVDRVTSDPALVGLVTHRDPLVNMVIELELPGEQPIAKVTPESNGWFHFAPHGLPPGEVVIRARAVKWQSDTDTHLYGDWYELTFTLEVPSGPVLVELEVFDAAQLEATDGGPIGEPVLLGVLDYHDAAAALLVEFDLDGDGEPEATTTVDAAGMFIYAPQDLPPGHRTLRARGVDVTEDEPLYGPWTAVTFMLAGTLGDPEIDSLALFNDTGDSTTDGITHDPTVSGTVQFPGSDASFVTVEFDYDANGVADATTITDAEGQFAFTPAGLAAGPVVIHARAVVFDPEVQRLRRGPWSSLSFTLESSDTLQLAVDELVLLNDDGETPGITSDPTVFGRVTPQFAARYATVELDWTGDLSPDARVVTDAEGTFTYRPMFATVPDPVELRARVVTLDVGGEEQFSDWSLLTFVFEPPVSTEVAQVAKLILRHDTGADDGITTDPSLVGFVEDDGPLEGLLVEIDLTGNAAADAVVSTDSAGRFHYLPAGLAAGQHLVQARAKEWNYSTAAYDVGDWVELEFELVEVTSAPSFAELLLHHVTGDNEGLPVTTDPTIHGAITHPHAVARQRIEFDLNGDEAPDAFVQTDQHGRFVFRPPGLTPGPVVISARATSWDYVTGSYLHGEWEEISFELELAPNAAPWLTAFYLLHDTGSDPLDGSTSDPTVAGTVGNDNGLAGLLVELDYDDDGVPDGAAAVASDGSFVFTPQGLSLGPVSLRARVREWDAARDEFHYSPWSSALEFTLDTGHTPAQIDSLELLVDDGDEPDDLKTTNPTVVGTISNDGAVAYLRVEFSYDGDDNTVNAFTFTDHLGRFTYRPFDLAPGEVELKARVAEWDYLLGDFVYGSWASIEFELVATTIDPPESPYEGVEDLLDTSDGLLTIADTGLLAAAKAAVAAGNSSLGITSPSDDLVHSQISSGKIGFGRIGPTSPASTYEPGGDSLAGPTLDHQIRFSSATLPASQAISYSTEQTTSGGSGADYWIRSESLTYSYDAVVDEQTGEFSIVLDVTSTFTYSTTSQRIVVKNGRTESQHSTTSQAGVFTYLLMIEGTLAHLGGSNYLLEGSYIIDESGSYSFQSASDANWFSSDGNGTWQVPASGTYSFTSLSEGTFSVDDTDHEVVSSQVVVEAASFDFSLFDRSTIARPDLSSQQEGSATLNYAFESLATGSYVDSGGTALTTWTVASGATSQMSFANRSSGTSTFSSANSTSQTSFSLADSGTYFSTVSEEGSYTKLDGELSYQGAVVATDIGHTDSRDSFSSEVSSSQGYGSSSSSFEESSRADVSFSRHSLSQINVAPDLAIVTGTSTLDMVGHADFQTDVSGEHYYDAPGRFQAGTHFAQYEGTASFTVHSHASHTLTDISTAIDVSTRFRHTLQRTGSGGAAGTQSLERPGYYDASSYTSAFTEAFNASLDDEHTASIRGNAYRLTGSLEHQATGSDTRSSSVTGSYSRNDASSYSSGGYDSQEVSSRSFSRQATGDYEADNDGFINQGTSAYEEESQGQSQGSEDEHFSRQAEQGSRSQTRTASTSSTRSDAHEFVYTDDDLPYRQGQQSSAHERSESVSSTSSLNYNYTYSQNRTSAGLVTGTATSNATTTYSDEHAYLTSNGIHTRAGTHTRYDGKSGNEKSTDVGTEIHKGTTTSFSRVREENYNNTYNANSEYERAPGVFDQAGTATKSLSRTVTVDYDAQGTFSSPRRSGTFVDESYSETLTTSDDRSDFTTTLEASTKSGVSKSTHSESQSRSYTSTGDFTIGQSVGTFSETTTNTSTHSRTFEQHYLTSPGATSRSSTTSLTRMATRDEEYGEQGTFPVVSGTGTFRTDRTGYSSTNETETGSVVTQLGQTNKTGQRSQAVTGHSTETTTRSYSYSIGQQNQSESTSRVVTSHNALDKDEHYTDTSGLLYRWGTEVRTNDSGDVTTRSEGRTRTVSYTNAPDHTLTFNYSETDSKTNSYSQSRTFSHSSNNDVESATFSRSQSTSFSSLELDTTRWNEISLQGDPWTNSLSTSRSATHRTTRESSVDFVEEGSDVRENGSHVVTGDTFDYRRRTGGYTYTDVEQTTRHQLVTHPELGTRTATTSTTSTQEQSYGTEWEFLDAADYTSVSGAVNRTGSAWERNLESERASHVYERMERNPAEPEASVFTTKTTYSTKSTSYSRERTTDTQYEDNQTTGGTTDLVVKKSDRDDREQVDIGWFGIGFPFVVWVTFTHTESETRDYDYEQHGTFGADGKESGTFKLKDNTLDSSVGVTSSKLTTVSTSEEGTYDDRRVQGKGKVESKSWTNGNLVDEETNDYAIDGYVPGAEPEVTLEPIEQWKIWPAAGWQFLHGFFYTLIPQFDQWADEYWQDLGLADSWYPTLYTATGVVSGILLDVSTGTQSLGAKAAVGITFRIIVAGAALQQGINNVAEGYVAIEQAETLGGALGGAAQIGVGVLEAGLVVPYLRAGRTLGIGAAATVRPANVAKAARGTVNSEGGALAAQFRSPLAKTGAQSNNVVYRSVSTAGDVQYVGITNDFAKRAATHLRTKGIDIERLLNDF